MTAVSVEGFHEFLMEYYHVDVVDLAAEFPNQRSMYIDWADLNEHNDEWGWAVLEEPDEFFEIAEHALATYPAKPPHGQLAFDPDNPDRNEAPFVRFTNIPEQTESENLFDEVGKLVSFEATIETVGEVQARLATAAFDCEYCGNRVNRQQVGRGLKEPVRCDGCGTERPFVVNSPESKRVESLFATVIPTTTEPRNGEVIIEFRHELIDAVEDLPLSEVAVSGIVHNTKMDGRRPRITVLANSLAPGEESPVPTPALDPYLGLEPPSDDELTKALSEFANRSSEILAYQQPLVEEEAQAKIITPLLHLLGWNVYSRQLRLEYSEPGMSGQVDYMLVDSSDEPRIPVEAKSPATDLRECKGQLERYARAFGCEVGMLASGDEFRLYGVPLDEDEDLTPIFAVTVSALPMNSGLFRLLTRESVEATDSLLGAFSSAR